MSAYEEILTDEQVEKYTHDDDGCLPAHRCHPDNCRDTRIGTLAREVQRLRAELRTLRTPTWRSNEPLHHQS